jgi:hypothetical protein
MWDNLKHQIQSFSSAVLTTRDATGYPVSVRTSCVIDDQRQAVGVTMPAAVDAQAGPASLLLHRHNEQLWDLRIVVVRGELVHHGDAWVFRPQPRPPDPSAFRMILNYRKAANAYVRKRGLARPRIPWDRLKAIKQC